MPPSLNIVSIALAELVNKGPFLCKYSSHISITFTLC